MSFEYLTQTDGEAIVLVRSAYSIALVPFDTGASDAGIVYDAGGQPGPNLPERARRRRRILADGSIMFGSDDEFWDRTQEIVSPYQARKELERRRTRLN